MKAWDLVLEGWFDGGAIPWVIVLEVPHGGGMWMPRMSFEQYEAVNDPSWACVPN